MKLPPSAGDIDERLADTTLLVIAHQYGVFTKAQVDELAKLVEEVHVFVRYNRLGDLTRFVDIDALQGHGKGDKVATDSPENVHVYPTPVTYLPIDLWYRNLGKHHYASVRRRVGRADAEFDLIHAHFTWSAGYVGARLSEDYDIPSVLTVHENQDWLSNELAWGNDSLEWGLRNHDAIIRVNEKDCERLEAFNDSVYAIPNGFDRDRFPYIETATARERLGLPPDADVIFSLGGLMPRKRFDMLIEAVAEVDHDGQLLCAIGGRGEHREQLERLAAGVDADVRILGYLSDDDLAAWMNACDIFALASEAEGNPTVMFEALGCGKPYVGTNVGGVDEIITSPEYGLYCPPDSRDGLVEIIESGLDRDWDREAILAYAEQYTWEQIARDIARVYDSVLAGRDHSRAITDYQSHASE